MHLKSSVDGFLCLLVKYPCPTLEAFETLWTRIEPKGSSKANIFGTFAKNLFDLIDNVEEVEAIVGNELVESTEGVLTRLKSGLRILRLKVLPFIMFALRAISRLSSP